MAESHESRIETYRQSWNSGSLDRLLSHWVEDGLDYSDYLTQQLHMDKPTAKLVFGGMLSLCGDIKMTTLGLTGTAEKAQWEAEIAFTCLADFPGSPFKKGDRARTVGVSLIEWNGEGKIAKQSDYYCWGKME